MFRFVYRGQEFNIIGYLATDYLAVGALQETILIGASVGCQGVNEADVRAFRRLNRTHPAIMGGVYVPDFKTRALAGQAAWPESRNTALVSDFRQRVVLVHELGQLAGAKELFHRGGYGLGVDK